MRPIAIAAVATALGLAGFAGGIYFNEHRATLGATLAGAPATQTQPPVVGSESSAQGETVPDPAPAVPASAPATVSWPALPPTDASVADMFEDLADRARRGDTGAACRLGVDLQRCTTLLARRELADNLQDQAARRSDTPDRMVDFIANIEQQHERDGKRCDGLQPAQLASAYEYQRQAAQARPELRTWFALNPALERRDFVNDLERWADYRRLAMPWLEAAAREGDVAALIALARVHGDLRRNSPPYPPFRLADDERTVAYSDLLLRYGVDFRGIEIGANRARSRLDADALSRATRLADSLYRPDAPRLDDAALRAIMQSTFEPLPAQPDCEPRS